jgi:phage tail sheath protein FI
MSYVAADNSTTDIINGKVEFTQTLAPWPPAEDIVNNLSFDPDMLTAALNA